MNYCVSNCEEFGAYADENTIKCMFCAYGYVLDKKTCVSNSSYGNGSSGANGTYNYGNQTYNYGNTTNQTNSTNQTYNSVTYFATVNQ